MKRAKGKSAADRLEAANSKELQATSKQSRQVRDSSGRHSSWKDLRKGQSRPRQRHFSLNTMPGGDHLCLSPRA